MSEVKDIFAQANQLHGENKLDEAEALYDKLLTQNHDNPGLLATMGSLYLQKQKFGLAISLMERSLSKVKERQPEILSNLGLAYKYAGQHDKAMVLLKEATVSKSPSSYALTSYGSMFVQKGDAATAIDILSQAVQLDESNSMAHWNLSLALMEDGQWAKAWGHSDYGASCKMRDYRKFDGIPEWDGKPGTTVLISGEQGIGDEIMFASILPDVLKTNNVVLECHERLVTLFKNSFGIPCYGTREERNLALPWLKDHQIDASIMSGSLGRYYRLSREAFPGTPYLKAESAPKSGKFRVGISWTGGAKVGRIMARTVPLSWWRAILNNDCEFVSLQYTDCADEIKIVNDSGYNIKQFPEIKAHDYNETAKLVQSCDLVISVCTSVIHLAGALGVPCWVMTPNRPAWRYQNTGGMPWYRSVRLYRQPPGDSGSWIPVVQRVGLDLSEFLAKREERAA